MRATLILLALAAPLTCGCQLFSGFSKKQTVGSVSISDRSAKTVGLAGHVSINDAQPLTPAVFEMNKPAEETDWLTGTHVVAIVNGEPLFAGELLHRQQRKLRAAREQLPIVQYRDVQEQLIRKQLAGYVDRMLMDQALRRSLKHAQLEMLDTQLEQVFREKELPRMIADVGANSQAELQQMLAEDNLTLEVFEGDFRQQQTAMEYLRQNARAREIFSPSEMLAWYREHLDEFQALPRVRWRQILVTHAKHGGPRAARAVIDEVARSLKSGADFATIARAHSDGPAAAEGGQWDWTGKGSFADDRVETALFSLPVGAVSDVLDGDGHFQILLITDREDGGAKPFASVQAGIEESLAEAERIREMKRIIDELKQIATVTTVFDKPGQPFFETTPGPDPDEQTPATRKIPDP